MGDGKFDWDEANRNHLAEHDITLQEAEEVLSGFCVEDEQEPVEGEGPFSDDCLHGTHGEGPPDYRVEHDQKGATKICPRT